MKNINVLLVLFILILGAGCNQQNDKYSESVDTYEPTPLTPDQLEAAARSFYIDIRYNFKKLQNAIRVGDSFDQEHHQNQIQLANLKLMTSGRYTETDAQAIFNRASNIGLYEDN